MRQYFILELLPNLHSSGPEPSGGSARTREVHHHRQLPQGVAYAELHVLLTYHGRDCRQVPTPTPFSASETTLDVTGQDRQVLILAIKF